MQWWGKAFEDWTRALLTTRHMAYSWGCVPTLIAIIWGLLRLALWLVGVVVLCVIGIFVGTAVWATSIAKD